MKKIRFINLFFLLLITAVTNAQLALVSDQNIDLSNAVLSVKSGNWEDPAVWSSGVVPDGSTDVIIEDGHTIYIDKQNPTASSPLDLCRNLQIKQSAILQMGHNGSFKDLRINGSILCNGTFSGGRNQPANGLTDDGVIYNSNARIYLKLEQETTYISGSGFFNPGTVNISSAVANRNVVVDIYNMICDDNFVVKSNNRVSVTIERYGYLRVRKVLGLTGSIYNYSSANAEADMTIRGIVVTDDVSLFTKNTNSGDSSSITIEDDGSLYTQKINNAALNVKTEAAGFTLTINSGGIFRLGQGVDFENLTTSNPHFTLTNNGDLREHYTVTLSDQATITSSIDANDPNNGADVDQIKDIFGSSHIAGWYNDTDEPFMIEGLDRYRDFGSSALKTTLTAENGKMFSAYPFNHTWPTFETLKEVAQHQYIDSLFSRTHIKTHAFWTTSKNKGDWKDGPVFQHDSFLNEEQQFYDLTKYLLETYGSMDKKFFYQNWEGDWMLRGQGVKWEDDATLIPGDIDWLIEGMGRLFRARQRGTERARNEHQGATAKVYAGIEFNKLWWSDNGTRKTMMDSNVPCVIADVVPLARIELSSWSAYDGRWTNNDNPEGHALWKGLEIARYYTNETGEFPTSFPVQVGEIAINENWPLDNKIPKNTIESRYGRYIGVALGLGIPNLYLWNLYCSGQQGGPPGHTWTKGEQYEDDFLYAWMDGKWLIEPDGTWGIAANFLMEQWNNTFLPSSGNWNSATNWSKGTIPSTTDNVVIPENKSVTISANIPPLSSLSNEGTININAGRTLRTTKNFINNGVINLFSDNDDSAVLLVEGNSIGNVTYTRGGLKAEKWSLVTAPISGQKIKEFAENANNNIRTNTNVSPVKYAIAYYDDSQTTGSKWQYYDTNVDPNEEFSAGRGYAFSRATDGDIKFFGTIRTKDVTKTVTEGQWNAIGNPFTTYYPANKNSDNSFLAENYNLLDDNFKSIYVWDPAQEKYVAVTELDAEDRSLTPGQGFFVKMKAGESSIPFRRSKRISKPASGNNQFNKSSNKQIELIVSNHSHSVKTDIRFFDHATLGFDVGYDIGNFGNPDFDIFSYLVDESNVNPYTIQSVPFSSVEEGIIVPLGIKTENESITMSINHQNLTQNTVILFEDKIKNTIVDITNSHNSIPISIQNREEAQKDRFYLHITNTAVLNENNFNVNDPRVYANKTTLYLQNVKNALKISIFNILGMKVYTGDVLKESALDLSGTLKPGSYIVKIESQNSVFTKKILIEN